MASWTDTATIKTAQASGKPLIGDGGHGDWSADNLQYLYDQAIAVGVQSSANIHDDFVTDALDTTNWIDTGDNAVSVRANPEHALTLNTTVTNQSCGIVGAAAKMRFDLDRDHSIRMRTTWGLGTTGKDPALVIGFQDATLTGDNACGASLTNVIAFCKGTNTDTLKAFVSKAGVSQTVADNLSDYHAVYLTLEIQITFSGATKKVEFFVGGSSVGSTTDTTKIPVVRMRPCIGQVAGAITPFASALGSARFFWTAMPVDS